MLRRDVLKLAPALGLFAPLRAYAAAAPRIKITDIKVRKLKLVKEVGALLSGYNRGGGRNRFAIGGNTIVEIHSDQGLVGIGPGSGGNADAGITPDVLAGMKTLLVGQDPFDMENHAFALAGRVGGPYAEIALWDLVGKASNQPLYKLWGGAKDRIMPYASQWTLGTPEERARMAVTVKNQGWKAIKLRSSFMTLKEDVQLVEAVRKAAGDDFIIATDGNKAGNGVGGLGGNQAPWDFKRAYDTAREYQRLNVYWLEEPLPRFDYDQLAELNRLVEMPLAGGESNMGVHEFLWMMQKGVFDFVQPEIMKTGPAMARTIAALAAAYNLRIVPHEGFRGLGTICCLHLVASWPHAPLVELIHEPPIGDFWNNLMVYENPPSLDKDGYITMPAGPGLGVTIKPDLFET